MRFWGEYDGIKQINFSFKHTRQIELEDECKIEQNIFQTLCENFLHAMANGVKNKINQTSLNHFGIMEFPLILHDLGVMLLTWGL
jgi:hypothetical protein